MPNKGERGEPPPYMDHALTALLTPCATSSSPNAICSATPIRIRRGRAAERRHRRHIGRSIEEEHVEQPFCVWRKEEERHQQQVKREQLHRNVVGHVERENLAHARHREQGAEQGSLRNEQQDARRHFQRAGEDLVRSRCADRRPQHAHWRKLPVRLEQPRQRGKRHLQRNQLRHAVAEHRRTEREAQEEPEPLVRGVVVDRTPRRRSTTRP